MKRINEMTNEEFKEEFKNISIENDKEPTKEEKEKAIKKLNK